MKLFDIDGLKEILETLTRNKSRTFLTGFGIFWGIFMLLAMNGGGKGLKNILSDNFEGFATNSVITGPNSTTRPYKGFKRGRWWDLRMSDVDYLKNVIPELEVVTPMESFWGRTAVRGSNSYRSILKGLSPDYALIETPMMKYGRYLSRMDVLQKRKVCVIGKRVYENLFPEGGDPCGEFIKVDGAYYEVVGLNVSKTNMNINGGSDESIVIPINVLQSAYNRGDRVELMAMTVIPEAESSEIQEVIRQALYRRHYIDPQDKSALIIVNAEKMYSMVDNLFKGLNVLIWLVGLGTLLAGAIGVSNIMMVTVKERTTEIGIRRAIGATPRMILGQIMSESVILTLGAGAIGIMFSVLLLSLVDIGASSAGLEYSFQVSFGTAVLAASVLAALGLIAGLAPATRAMAIKPVDAMRDE
ncbi:MAG: ABC transporter permease [Candidatus Cryptobacteroides sp.]|nr:ABC transporter permease [Bacteroidales bacterium]